MRSFLPVLLLASVAFGQEATKLPNRVRTPEASKAQPATAGQAVLWLDPAEWSWVESGSETVQTFLYLRGGAQARWIARDEGGVPEALLAETLDKIQKVDHEAQVVFTERRLVNDAEVLCVQIRANKDQKRDIVYFGYIFADEERSHQLYTISSGWTLSQSYAELNEFLDGLVVVGPESRLLQ